MPRKPTHKPGTRPYGTKTRYTKEKLQEILHEIQSGQISQRKASLKYKIARNTLKNKIKKLHTKNVGRPVVFSQEEEQAFVDHILILSDLGLPISLYDVRCIAKNYLDSNSLQIAQFKNNFPGWDWGQNFFKRHKTELVQRFEVNISRRRAQVNEEIINNFFDNLETALLDVPPANFFNMDETGFHDIPQKKKLLFQRGCRNPERIRNSTKSCFTVVFCGSASGNFLPPYVIMKGSQKWSDWIYGAPKGTRLNTSQSGWIDANLFDDFFELHFLPVCRKLDGKKILICDNMSAHVTIKSLQLAKTNDICLLFFPPNATHLLQPLDVGYFSSLKNYWRQILAKWRETKTGKKTVALPKSIFCQLLNSTLELGTLTASDNLVKGFEATGICPINRDKVLSKLPTYAMKEPKIKEKSVRYFKVI